MTGAADAYDEAGFRDAVDALRDHLQGRFAEVRGRLAGGRPSGSDYVAFLERQRLIWLMADDPARPAWGRVVAEADLARIAAQGRRRVERRERLGAELRRLLPAFVEVGLDVTLLKGPHLVERFPRVARRTFADLDLLVRPADVEAASARLASLGYECLSRPLFSPRLSRRFTHGFDFIKGGLRVDLHWSVASHVSYRPDLEGLWRRRHRLRFADGFEATVLAEEDLLAALLVSLFEDLDRRGARLRSFVDLDGVLSELDGTIDWSGFWRARAEERTQCPCASVLALFLLLLGDGGRFPNAEAHLPAAATVERPGWAEAAALLGQRRSRVFAKRWALRRYECPAWQHAAWWMLSLPFRLAVYRPGTRDGRASAPSA